MKISDIDKLIKAKKDYQSVIDASCTDAVMKKLVLERNMHAGLCRYLLANTTRRALIVYVQDNVASFRKSRKLPMYTHCFIFREPGYGYTTEVIRERLQWRVLFIDYLIRKIRKDVKNNPV